MAIKILLQWSQEQSKKQEHSRRSCTEVLEAERTVLTGHQFLNPGYIWMKSSTFEGLTDVCAHCEQRLCRQVKRLGVN